MLKKLKAKVHDDLKWKDLDSINPEELRAFEFELGLEEPYFPIDDPLHFASLSRALTHFSENVYPRFPVERAVLYRGALDFSRCFSYTDSLKEQLTLFQKEYSHISKEHARRLFCTNIFVNYFQLLAHRLPDEMELQLIFDDLDCGTPAERLHLLSKERFAHFSLEYEGGGSSSTTGVCFPSDPYCSSFVLEKIDHLLSGCGSFREVYEPFLTEMWDGLDEIYVIDGAVTELGERKLLGFQAAGGTVIRI